jgi:hypothetical protein
MRMACRSATIHTSSSLCFALIVDCNKHGNLWVSIGFFGSNEESYLRTRLEQGPWLSMAKTQVAKIEST